jgi:mRNA interferase HigB
VLITSLDRIAEFSRQHANAAERLAAWVDVTTATQLRSLAEVRRTYGNADAVKLQSGRTVTVFNLGGNRYRLLTSISYPLGIVNVLALLTHAEYDKEKWKKTL